MTSLVCLFFIIIRNSHSFKWIEPSPRALLIYGQNGIIISRYLFLIFWCDWIGASYILFIFLFLLDWLLSSLRFYNCDNNGWTAVFFICVFYTYQIMSFCFTFDVGVVHLYNLWFTSDVVNFVRIINVFNPALVFFVFVNIL